MARIRSKRKKQPARRKRPGGSPAAAPAAEFLAVSAKEMAGYIDEIMFWPEPKFDRLHRGMTIDTVSNLAWHIENRPMSLEAQRLLADFFRTKITPGISSDQAWQHHLASPEDRKAIADFLRVVKIKRGRGRQKRPSIVKFIEDRESAETEVRELMSKLHATGHAYGALPEIIKTVTRKREITEKITEKTLAGRLRRSRKKRST
jgi:hypothetical protein